LEKKDLNKFYLEIEYPEGYKIESEEKWKMLIELAKEKNPFFN
jgi:hypothetical protein